MNRPDFSRRFLASALFLSPLAAAATPALAAPHAKMRHVVLVKFASGTTPAQIKDVFKALADLKKVVPGMLSFSAGANVSPEGLARGYTHGFVVDFADAKARDAYLEHPDHKKAGAALVALCEGGIDGIAVVDFAMHA